MSNYQPTRRRIVMFDSIENRTPGRMAYVVHRSRSRSRSQAMRSYLALHRWAQRRHRLLLQELEGVGRDADDASEAFETSDSTTDEAAPAAKTSTSDSDGGQSGAAGSQLGERPDETWTKGRIYELARRMELDGRSKLNKADLLDAVQRLYDSRVAPGS